MEKETVNKIVRRTGLRFADVGADLRVCPCVVAATGADTQAVLNPAYCAHYREFPKTDKKD
jgi:hypothetical protein